LRSLIAQLSSRLEVKTYSNEEYYNFKDLGLALQWKRDGNTKTLHAVHFYAEGVDGFHRYKGKLPYDIQWHMNNVDIVKKFGEPEGKPKPNLQGLMNIYVDYRRLGLLIDFKNTSYEDKNNPMTCITIYLPQSQ
jgi:hypothetical protein